MNPDPLRSTTLALFALLALVVGSACVTPIRAGWSAFHDGDYGEALERWEPLAESGEADAQFLVGVLYEEGQGVPVDREQAARWYELAAEQGHAPAQNNLGLIHFEAAGSAYRPDLAAHWFGLAAEQGYARAHNNLAVLHLQGAGVPADAARAEWHLRQAAATGDAAAARGLVLLGAVDEEDVPDLRANAPYGWDDDLDLVAVERP